MLGDTVERFYLTGIHYCATSKIWQNIIIAAHGNSLRALAQYLNNFSEEEILNFNIPTGIPLVYELDDNLKPIQNYYLGNLSEIQQAIQSVADQARTKT
jgi:2,3-bisphosphoglycerate-dependent phosphoglycerate mutase